MLKLGFILTVIFFASAFLTAAPAVWYENIANSTAVTTGSLDAKIECSTGSANGSYEWQYAVLDARRGDVKTCTYTISNTGNTPWHIESLAVTVAGAGSSITTCTGGVCTWGSTANAVQVGITDTVGCGVDAGQSKSGSFSVTVNSGASSGATYNVSVAFVVNLWNQSAFAGCRFP